MFIFTHSFLQQPCSRDCYYPYFYKKKSWRRAKLGNLFKATQQFLGKAWMQTQKVWFCNQCMNFRNKILGVKGMKNTEYKILFKNFKIGYIWLFEDTDIRGKTIKKSRDHKKFEIGSQEDRRGKGLEEMLREIVLLCMLLCFFSCILGSLVLTLLLTYMSQLT